MIMQAVYQFSCSSTSYVRRFKKQIFFACFSYFTSVQKVPSNKTSGKTRVNSGNGELRHSINDSMILWNEERIVSIRTSFFVTLNCLFQNSSSSIKPNLSCCMQTFRNTQFWLKCMLSFYSFNSKGTVFSGMSYD